jgi:hypothetical protein
VTPPSGGGGGGTVNPPPVTPTPAPPVPIKYVAKADGTILGPWVSGSICTNYVYNNGSGNVSLGSYDCGTDYGPPPSNTDVFFSNTGCTGTVLATEGTYGATIYFIQNGVNYYSNSTVWPGGWTTPGSFWSYTFNNCQNSFSSGTKYTVFTAPPHLCSASGSPCITKYQ